MIETVVFPCTYHCDGKCIMCTIYERKCSDLSIETLERFFSSPQIRNIRSLNLTGGEPTLREDLPQLVDMIVKNCVSLKEIIINTNGLNPERISRQIEKILEVLDNKIKLWILVSMDSVGVESDYIRGVKEAANKEKKTIQKLKTLKGNFLIGISCTITSKNYNALDGVLNYVKKEDIYIDFMCATVNTAYINSKPKAADFILNESQKKEVIQFLTHVGNYKKILSSKIYFQKMIERLNGKKVFKECILREGKGVLLEADGKIRPCGMDEEIILGNILESNDFSNLGYPLEKKYKVFCEQCDTDSYFSWTREAQEQILKEMLMNFKRKN